MKIFIGILKISNILGSVPLSTGCKLRLICSIFASIKDKGTEPNQICEFFAASKFLHKKRPDQNRLLLVSWPGATLQHQLLLDDRGKKESYLALHQIKQALEHKHKNKFQSK